MAAGFLSSVLQRRIAPPSLPSSSSTRSATGTFALSPYGTEVEGDVASGTFGSSADFDSKAAPSITTTAVFTTAPMLGSPVQLDGQPVSSNLAAVGHDSGEGDFEQQAAQPYNVPVNFSIVTASVKKRAMTRLISNSLSLAAAIEEADESAAKTGAPESEGKVSLQGTLTGLLHWLTIHMFMIYTYACV